MGGVLAELLAGEGYSVELVTPAAHVSEWTANTMELGKIRRRLMSVGVQVTLNRTLERIGPRMVTTQCVFTGQAREHRADAVVLVTSRVPQDALHRELIEKEPEWADAGVRGVHLVGDSLAPSTIAAAVWSGRSLAERLEADGPTSESVFLREVTRLAD
jgi:dimethylamine/trimethylamine dehydrogenase